MAVILIVDDAPENCRFLSNILIGRGDQVRALPNATLAMISIEKHPPDIILLDIMMPETDGFELCRWLKSHEIYQGIPVIFLSAMTNEKTIIEGFELGAVDFIRKPFYPMEVCKRVEIQLAIIEKDREIQSTLSHTLLGSIQAILDIILTIDPSLYGKSSAFIRWMRQLIDKLKLDKSWRYESSAMLYSLNEFLAYKHDMKDSEILTQILRGIPRLNEISEMLDPVSNDKDFDDLSDVEKGRYLLKLLDRLYQFIVENMSWKKIEENFETEGEVGKMLLEIYKKEMNLVIKDYKVHELLSGMIVIEDILTESGLKLISKGTQLTINLLILLRKYQKTEGVRLPIKCSHVLN